MPGPTVPDDGYSGPPPIVAMGGACVLFDADGRVLLVRHTYGRLNWELPGGASEPGESPDETAIREIREETGLAVELERLTGVYYEAGARPGHDHGPILHVVFAAHATGDGQPEARPPEIGAVGWWPLDDLPAPMSDFTERRIRDAAAGSEASVVRFEGRVWRDAPGSALG
jgi:8-oxo-dGTP diphosphatase